MNILVTNISKLPLKNEEKNYLVDLNDYDGVPILAVHTNESILKCISHLKSVNGNGGINKIIALVSSIADNQISEVFNKTAFDYYSEKVKECCGDIEIKKINIETAENKPIPEAQILNQICSQIVPSDVVYIDNAGGARTTSSLIQLLAKLLKYKGIKNPYNLYSDIQNNQARIYDVSAFMEMTEIADAMNEFMTSGKAEQLNNIFKDKNLPEQYKKLLKIITEFSDKIRLGVVDSLDSTVEKLKQALDDCKSCSVENADNIGIIILKQFLETIDNKLIGDMQEGPDYLKITQWCIENGLIQQALTVFNEKMPRYLFNKGYIKVTDEERKACIESNTTFDWEYVAMWNHLLSVEKEENPMIAEFKDAVLKDKPSKNPLIQKRVAYIKTIDVHNPPTHFEDEYKCLEDLFKKNYKNNQAFQNDLCFTNPKVVFSLLGLDFTEKNSEKKREENFNSKFIGIKNLENSFIPSGFSFLIKKEKIIFMLYSYAYVKAVRNQSNHASAEENLSDEHKELLKKYGFNFDDNSLEIIKKNLELAAYAFIPDFDNKKKKTEAEPEVCIFSTDLKVGDVVTVNCVDKKIVHLGGYNYDIPLVIPEGENPIQYINCRLKVEIRQISKSQKICQVKYLETI